MKKTLTMALGLAVVAATAFAEPTYSKNAVGFINTTVEPGQMVVLTVPFEDLDHPEMEGWAFTNTSVAKSAPNFSSVYFWDPEKVSWAETDTKSRRGVWSTTHVLKQGEGFFFQLPQDAEESFVATIAGQVPADGSIPVALAGKGGLTAVANPYPVEVAFTNTSLASNAPNYSTVYFWDVEKGSWAETDTKTRRGVWSTTHVLKPGEGFFFQADVEQDPMAWEEIKPYAWPKVED